jgi:hypothetical protein
MTTAPLEPAELDLLQWLSGEDFSQYGECHGAALDRLVELGLAQVHGPGEHQSGFVAHGTGSMYRAVSLTEAGWQVVRENAARTGAQCTQRTS